jgi:signal transduction histidine kinase
MIDLHFDPAARLQRYLGRELIADPNLAIIEFVKNAYDGGASEVVIDFHVEGPIGGHAIVISDNGVGMSVDAFKSNWMRPGYSYKVTDTKPTSRRSEAAKRMAARVPSGEKGLGRLAAGRLGERLDVYTRESSNDPWFHVIFDWRRFEELYRSISEIEIDNELDAPPSNARFPSGTVVKISDVQFNWSQLVRGRKVQDRADSRIGRLREDLSLLLEPFTPTGSDFQVVIGVDAPALQSLAGPVAPDEPSIRDYTWNFKIVPASDGEGVTIERTIRRSKRVRDATGLGERTTERKRRGREESQRGHTLRCGPIEGSFYYSPPQIAARGESLGRAPGVYLYRDGIRVEPFGSADDDWLGVQARKASRQGWSAIQPNLLTGYIEITRAGNPDLIDMSNRNGLVENDAYEDLVTQLRVEFLELDKRVLTEIVQPNWTPPEVRAQQAAKRAQTYATALTRQVTHSVRTPVASLGAEIRTVETVAKQLADEAPRQELLGVARRARGHLDDIERSLGRLMAVSAIELGESIKDVELVKLVRDAVARCSSQAELAGVTLKLGSADEVTVQTEELAVSEAIVELISNAIEATRAGRGGGKVTVSMRRADSRVEIRVADEGSGVRPEVKERLFQTSVSTRGRPGFGLVQTRELLALVNAEVQIESTGAEGSTFLVLLPTASATRKEVTR